jgi:membrane associated rhomboid family serine protease
MFFPFGTDAPIYYWPFTTVAMIVVNVLVFALEVAHPELVDSLMLETGSGLHPVQWLTANFAHADFLHIAGNMIFLWSFGLIVEGKLGWWKTLIIYLGLGIGLGAFVQTLMLFGSVQHGLGASGIVFAFMALSLVWAPANSLQCVFIISVYVKWIDISIQVFVALFLALQVLELIVTGMTLSGALVHAIGAALGFGLGTWMVKTKRVDCENWDIFSLFTGRNRMSEKERNEEVLNSAEYRRQQLERTSKRSAEALQWIRQQIGEGNTKATAEVYRRVRGEMPGWRLPDIDLFRLIAALRKAGLHAEVIPLMADYLAHYTTHAIAVRIALGETLLRQRRPAQALKVLGKLPDAALDARQRPIVLGLREKAGKLHAEDPYEVAEEDW